jgi:hypothetical protein
LSLFIKEDFKIFLKNSQHTFIEKLSILQKGSEEDKGIYYEKEEILITIQLSE